jgi:putative transposase
MVAVLAAVFRWRKHPIGKSLRIDETYIKMADESNVPSTCTMCQRRSVPIRVAPTQQPLRASRLTPTSLALMRQCKYFDNIIEQDHRAIKRIARPIRGFKSFWSARIIIAGIESMHMIRKGQMDGTDGKTMSAANQFYSLAA